MAKIRVNDLARKMGMQAQDLIFKLKSIGVRVDGDDASIDPEIIQAILTGKRLPSPREVIVRDDDSPDKDKPGVRPHIRKAQPQAQRRARRSMIQRVDQNIRNLEPEKPEVAPAKEAPAPAEPSTPQQTPAASATAPPAVASSPPAPAKTGPEAREAPPESKAPPRADTRKEGEKAPPPRRRPSGTAAVRSASARKTAPPAGNRRGPGRSAASAVRGRPAMEVRRTREIVDPDDKSHERVLRVDPPKRPRRRDEPARDRDQRDQHDRRQERRTEAPSRRPERPVRPAARPAAAGARKATPARETSLSERGKRRAQRRQDQGSTGALAFKEERPDGPVTIVEGMTVREFAEKLGVKSKDLIKALVQRGVLANINHVLDKEIAAKLAEDLGVETMEVTFEEEIQLQHEVESEEDAGTKEPRAPVVTVMGHVDHGKTTLLDAIRSTSVAAGEAGGITQHIGAYHVDLDGKKIVFLDTPGHEAFTMMRARGASVTDIVVLVVAADDSVMPQTIEAIAHARAADVPIVVAINKIDKANANVDRVRKELADHELLLEDWGGDTVSVQISALKKEGISELLEMLLLTADLLELKAAPDVPASGVVLESRKEVGRGIVATVLVQDGTLSTGDVYVSGATWGRVRSMSDDEGNRVKSVGPATPVEVTGFDDVPEAGDLFQVVQDESKARGIADLRREEARRKALAPRVGKMSLEQLFSKIEEGEVKELPVIVKADVQGSVEVLKDTLAKLSTEKVKVNVIQSAVGAISTNDVILASASEAIIVGFNVRPERNAASLAEREEVEIRLHTVIYELADELKAAMTGLLEPTYQEVIKGTAEVRETFRVPKIGTIAGSHVTDGVIPRSSNARLLRDNVVVWEGRLGSLRRFKDDVSEVRSGFDCGIGLDGYQDLKPGDVIEAYVREEVAPTL